MATIGHHRAVAEFGNKEFSGLIAWLLWSVVHVFLLIGFPQPPGGNERVGLGVFPTRGKQSAHHRASALGRTANPVIRLAIPLSEVTSFA